MSRVFPSTLEVSGPNEKIILGSTDLTLIAGPCALESEEHSIHLAHEINKICQRLGVQYIFKGSFDKDGRSSPDSFHGVGMKMGRKILSSVRDVVGVPTTTDFSVPSDAKDIADVVDLIQVPAYLCRQTSMLKAAAETGLPVHVKKGQFMSPQNLRNSALKLRKYGATGCLLTDRGTFFGYSDLVNDFRAQIKMADIAVAGFDATHSIQQPTTSGVTSTGLRRFIPPLTRAAMATGTKVLFMEVHENPAKALGDPGTVLDIQYLETLLIQAQAINKTVTLMSDQTDLDFLEGLK